MGASGGKDGAFCCGGAGSTVLPCCAKESEGSNKGEIMRTKPVPYQAERGETGIGINGDDRSSEYNVDGKSGDNPQVGATDGVDKEEIYEDGSVYFGQLLGGLRHGHGSWMSASEEYTGQWTEDQRHGQGRQTWEDGRIFEGEFRDGRLHGYGRMEWHTPSGLMVYEGEYEHDLKHGSGRYLWPDGRSYVGDWRGGLRHGRAVYTNTTGMRRAAIWNKDQPEMWLEDEVGERDGPSAGTATTTAAFSSRSQPECSTGGSALGSSEVVQEPAHTSGTVAAAGSGAMRRQTPNDMSASVPLGALLSEIK